MGISADTAKEVLVKCARHCCICRRFRPLQLQVHHINEASSGGGNELENLIAICVSCHSDVHTATKLTRRFTAAELKSHRDAVYALVQDGKLPGNAASGPSSLDAIAAHLLETLQRLEQKVDAAGIPRLALDILLSAACEESLVEIHPVTFTDGRPSGRVWIRAGQRGFHPDERCGEQLPSPINALVARHLLAATSTDRVFALTNAAYNLADTVLSTMSGVTVASKARFTIKKVICSSCGVHFALYTDHPKRHGRTKLYCPECGAHEGGFTLYQQREFGFIFQHVPGSALPVDS